MQDPTPLDEAIADLKRQMDAHGRAPGEPVRAISSYVGDRWSTLILLVLAMGTWRHAELRRILAELSHEGAISQRIMTLKLRALERDGMVTRQATSDVPPKVSYSLSENGEGLVEKIKGLIDWVESRSGAIRASRNHYDSERAD